jgi:hypothetical protein
MLGITGCKSTSVTSAWHKMTFNAFAKKSKAGPALTNAPAAPEVPQTGSLNMPPQANLAPANVAPVNATSPTATQNAAVPQYTPVPAPPLTTTYYPAFGSPYQAVTPASYPSTSSPDYSVGGNYALSAAAAATSAAGVQSWGAPQPLPTNTTWPTTSNAQTASHVPSSYPTSGYAANSHVSYFQQTAPPAPQTGYDTRPPVRTASSTTGYGGPY